MAYERVFIYFVCFVRFIVLVPKWIGFFLYKKERKKEGEEVRLKILNFEIEKKYSPNELANSIPKGFTFTKEEREEIRGSPGH